MMVRKIDSATDDIAPISIRALAVGALAIGAVALGAVANRATRDWLRKNQADGNRRARREEGSYYRFVRNALNEVASDHTAAIRTCYSTSISRTAFRARIASTWFRILSPRPIVHGMASMKINGDEASEVFNCTFSTPNVR